HHPELMTPRLADPRFRQHRAMHTRQLDQDPVAALTCDRRLGHAELIDAVTDRLQPLAYRVVPQLADAALAHYELEAARRLVVVASLERPELRHDGQEIGRAHVELQSR